MIDHVGLGVSDLERSEAFYREALAPLGYEPLIWREGTVGFGRDRKPDFNIEAVCHLPEERARA